MMFRSKCLEHHAVPNQEVDSIRANRVLHHESDSRLHKPMANDGLERALRQRRTTSKQSPKMTGEPAVKFTKITVAENSLAFDRVEQGERPLGGLAMKVILDHVED